MSATKHLFWIIITLILLVYSGWYFSTTKASFKLDSETLSSIPDSIVSQLTVRQFNTKGALVNVLITPLMEHIPQGDVNLLQSPHVVITQDDQPAWEIHSLKAKAFAGGE